MWIIIFHDQSILESGQGCHGCFGQWAQECPSEMPQQMTSAINVSKLIDPAGLKGNAEPRCACGIGKEQCVEPIPRIYQFVSDDQGANAVIGRIAVCSKEAGPIRGLTLIDVAFTALAWLRRGEQHHVCMRAQALYEGLGAGCWQMLRNLQ